MKRNLSLKQSWTDNLGINQIDTDELKPIIKIGIVFTIITSIIKSRFKETEQ